MALKALLSTAREQGLDVDRFAEAAIDDLLKFRVYDDVQVPMAISEIEVAVDALVVE
jgi:hypothetical protein